MSPVLLALYEDAAAGKLAKLLESIGFSIAGYASSCDETIAKTSELLPDLVVIDAANPEAAEIAGQIRTQFGVSVIILAKEIDEIGLRIALDHSMMDQSAVMPEPEVAGEMPANPASISDAIVLVDDNPEVRQLTEFILQDSGYEVLSAEDAEEALRIVAEKRDKVCLVMSDISLPGMDGRELRRQILDRFPELPVMLVSGSAPAPDESAETFLQKPFSFVDLIEKVEGMRRKVNRQSSSAASSSSAI